MMNQALGLSNGSGPPSPAHSPQVCHAPSPLPGPCCRAWLFLLIHALELWRRGLELGTKFRHGGAGRQPGIHTRCTRNAQAECLAFESPGEAAQSPCPISLPLQPLVPCPLLTVPGAFADLPNSRPHPFLTLPQMQAPETLPGELPGNMSVGLIIELTFLDLGYNSPGTWVTKGVCPGSQVLPSLNAE